MPTTLEDEVQALRLAAAGLGSTVVVGGESTNTINAGTVTAVNSETEALVLIDGAVDPIPCISVRLAVVGARVFVLFSATSGAVIVEESDPPTNLHDWIGCIAPLPDMSSLAGPNYNSTSTTSLTIPSSAVSPPLPQVTFTTGTGLTYFNGKHGDGTENPPTGSGNVRLTSAGTPADWMQGAVLSYNPTTGVMTINVRKSSGVGNTHADWQVGAHYDTCADFSVLLGGIPVKFAETANSHTGNFDWAYVEHPYAQDVFGRIATVLPTDPDYAGYLTRQKAASDTWLAVWGAASAAGITPHFMPSMIPADAQLTHTVYKCHTNPGSATMTTDAPATGGDGVVHRFKPGDYTAGGDVGRPVHDNVNDAAFDPCTIVAVASDGTSCTLSVNAKAKKDLISVTVDGDFAMGALGLFNAHWTVCAESFVSAGLPNAIVKLGSEFNFSLIDNTTGKDFVGYWKQIVNTMRAVSPDFQFFWCPARDGSSPTDNAILDKDISLGDWYPFGNDAIGKPLVDIAGMDFYDQFAYVEGDWKDGDYWNGVPRSPAPVTGCLNEKYGLAWLSTFAQNQGPKIAFGEWGLWRDDLAASPQQHGGGDHPDFIKRFAQWSKDNNVYFACFFEDGTLNTSLDKHPLSLTEAQLDFGPYVPGPSKPFKLPDNIMYVDEANDTQRQTSLDGSGGVVFALRRNPEGSAPVQDGDTLGIYAFGGFYNGKNPYNMSARMVGRATEDWDATSGGTALDFWGTPNGTQERVLLATMDTLGVTVQNRPDFAPNQYNLLGKFSLNDTAVVRATAAEDGASTAVTGVRLEFDTLRAGAYTDATEAARFDGNQNFTVGNSGRIENADLWHRARVVSNVRAENVVIGTDTVGQLTCTDDTTAGHGDDPSPFNRDDIGRLVTGFGTGFDDGSGSLVIPADCRVSEVTGNGTILRLDKNVSGTVAADNGRTVIQLGVFNNALSEALLDAIVPSIDHAFINDWKNYKLRSPNMFIGHYSYLHAGDALSIGQNTPSLSTASLNIIDYRFDDAPNSNAGTPIPGPRGIVQWEGGVRIGPNAPCADTFGGALFNSSIGYTNANHGQSAHPGGIVTGTILTPWFAAGSTGLGGTFSIGVVTGDIYNHVFGATNTGTLEVADLIDFQTLDFISQTAGTVKVHNWIGIDLRPPTLTNTTLDNAIALRIGPPASRVIHFSCTAGSADVTATSGTTFTQGDVGKRLLVFPFVDNSLGPGENMRFITAVADSTHATFNMPFATTATITEHLMNGLSGSYSGATNLNVGIANGMDFVQSGASLFTGDVTFGFPGVPITVDFTDATVTGIIGGDAIELYPSGKTFTGSGTGVNRPHFLYCDTADSDTPAGGIILNNASGGADMGDFLEFSATVKYQKNPAGLGLAAGLNWAPTFYNDTGIGGNLSSVYSFISQPTFKASAGSSITVGFNSTTGTWHDVWLKPHFASNGGVYSGGWVDQLTLDLTLDSGNTLTRRRGLVINSFTGGGTIGTSAAAEVAIQVMSSTTPTFTVNVDGEMLGLNNWATYGKFWVGGNILDPSPWDTASFYVDSASNSAFIGASQVHFGPDANNDPVTVDFTNANVTGLSALGLLIAPTPPATVAPRNQSNYVVQLEGWGAESEFRLQRSEFAGAGAVGSGVRLGILAFAGEDGSSRSDPFGQGAAIWATSTQAFDGTVSPAHWGTKLQFGTMENSNGGLFPNIALTIDQDQSSKFQGAFGYATGVSMGGSVTQATSKTTAVTLNKLTGKITMSSAALANSANALFTVTNSTVAAVDVVIVNHQSVGVGNYMVTVEAVSAGSFQIMVRNVSGASQTQALVLNFAVIKAANN